MTRHMTFRDHFSDRAAGYAAHRPSYPPQLLEYLAGLPARRGLAWDAGCGSGQLSVPLADHFDRVVATDASAKQIAAAVTHPHVDYWCAAAEASPLPDAVVDLAVAAQAAHWFDLPAYYAEVRRVARPGCVLALVSYGLMRIDDDIDRIVDRFYADLQPWWPPERTHVEDGYRSLPFPFTPIPAPQLEMAATWTRADVIGYVRTWSAVLRMESTSGETRMNAFRSELEHAWGDTKTRHIRWPLSLRIGEV